MANFDDLRRALSRKEPEPEPEKRGKCVVCKGDLVDNMVTPYIPTENRTFGGEVPTYQHGYKCPQCGIAYADLPKGQGDEITKTKD